MSSALIFHSVCYERQGCKVTANHGLALKNVLSDRAKDTYLYYDPNKTIETCDLFQNSTVDVEQTNEHSAEEMHL